MTELATPPTEQKQGLTRISHWIGGKTVAGTSGRTSPVYNPALGQQSGEVDLATAEEVGAAVAAAKAAFPAWRATSLAKRAELFFRIRELLHERREEVARILTAEHGKVLSDAMGEVTRGLEVIEFCCGIPHLLKGDMSEQASTGIDVYSIRQPLGVVAGITPFNFPAMVPMWMWAPALACGNTFVLKPSEKDPSASIWTAELLTGGGSPRRSLQRRARGQGRGRRAARAPGRRRGQLRRLDADRALHLRDRHAGRQARPGARRGEEPYDRPPGRDIDMAADAAVSAGYGSAGERCMAISQVVAVGDAGDKLVEAIKAAAAEDQGRQRPRGRRRDGPARHARAPRQGRLVHRGRRGAGRDRGRRRPRDALPRATGSSSASRSSTTSRPNMDAYKDEIFGPVLGITRVGTYDEAVSW